MYKKRTKFFFAFIKKKSNSKESLINFKKRMKRFNSESLIRIFKARVVIYNMASKLNNLLPITYKDYIVSRYWLWNQRSRSKKNILNKLYNRRFDLKLKYPWKRILAFSYKREKLKILPIFSDIIKKEEFLMYTRYQYLNISNKIKNYYINYSTYEGQVVKSFSSGSYHKGRLKRSYYGLESLLLKSPFNFKIKKKKKITIINIKAPYRDFKIKKNLKRFLFRYRFFLNIDQIVYKKSVAHNGVRSRKQRRK